MAGINLSLLGPFVASVDGRPINNFRTKATQALLIYLACQPEQAHRRDHLMTLLAPGLPKKSAQANLRQTLYQLRQVLSATAVTDDDSVPFLLSDWQTIQINPEAACEVDVLTFESALRAGEAHWGTAVELYRGDFLADFYLPGSSAFEEWAEVKRQAYRHQALETLERLTAVAIRRTDYAKAHAYAEKQLAIDNLRENAYRQLMEILARNGRRRAAISQYKLLTQLLHDELAIEPTASTQALHEAIRSGEFEGTAVSPPSASKRPKNNHNLPTQTTPFFGREAELSTLKEFMTDQGARLVTIVGPGGMGKTRLALEAARQQLDNFDHGVWFTSLAKLSSPDEIVPATAQALDFSFYEGGPPRQQLLDYLRNKSLLLIFDNYEHLLDGADLVTDVLKNAPQVNVLVTSREPLRLVEEQLFPLSGLAFSPEKISETDEAVQFFLERAQHLRPDLTLKADDMTHITTICRQVEGMPLGLELAATWVDTLSLAEIAAELQESLDLLESDMRNAADRHRSLRAVFAASWDRLQPHEQQLFAQLSIFRGGFTRTAAKEICAPNLSRPAFHRLLATLTRKSFLKHDMGHGRYDIHELMRQYGAEKLAQSPDQKETVKNRHRSYYLALLQKSEPELKSANAEISLQEIQDDIDNIYTAWHRAVDQQNFPPLGNGLFSLEEFWARSGRFEEGLTMLGQASDSIKGLVAQKPNVNPTDLLVLVQLLSYQCMIQNKVGLREQTSKLGKEALAILEQPELQGKEIRFEKALILSEMGRSSFWRDRIGEAQKLLKTSILLFQSVGDFWHLAHAYRSLAGTYMKLGDFEQSIKTGTKALAIFEELNNKRWTARLKTGMGLNIGFLGNCAESERIQLESIAVFREIEDWEFEATTITQLSVTYIYCGRYEQALESAENSARKHKELGKKGRQAQSLEQLCWAALHLGQYDRVINQFPAVLELTYQVNQPMATAMTQYAAGCAWLGLNQPEGARELLEESAMTLREINSPDYLILALSSLSCVAIKEGNLIQAKKILLEALAIKFADNMNVEKSVICAAAAFFLASVGKMERAVEVYVLACLHPYVANSRWFEDIIGKQITDATTLSPETVAAAQKHGRSLNLRQTAVSLLQEISASNL